MTQERCLGNYRVRVNPEEIPQVSWDDGKTWEDIDVSEVVENLRFEMGGGLVKRFYVAPPNQLLFTKVNDITKW